MFSSYRIPPNGHKRKEEISNREHDLERPQRTPNDLKRPQSTSKETSSIFETVKPKKNKLKGGGNLGNIDK